MNQWQINLVYTPAEMANIVVKLSSNIVKTNFIADNGEILNNFYA